jgi:uncharacterized membrane protein HdeD (DUF308 family)
VAIVAGVVALVWPHDSLSVATVVLAAGLVVVGACELVDGVRRRHFAEEWVFALLRALALVGSGAYLLLVSDDTIGLLATACGAAWSVVGALELLEGFRARRGVREGRFRVARGLVALAGGLAILVWPDPTTVALGRLSGAVLVALGLLCFPSALVLRQVGQLQRPVRLDVVR